MAINGHVTGLARKAIGLTSADTRLGGLATPSAAVVHLAFDLCIGTDILESSGIPVVAVDASKLATIDSSNTLDVNIALALFGALVMYVSR